MNHGQSRGKPKNKNKGKFIKSTEIGDYAICIIGYGGWTPLGEASIWNAKSVYGDK